MFLLNLSGSVLEKRIIKASLHDLFQGCYPIMLLFYTLILRGQKLNETNHSILTAIVIFWATTLDDS